MPIPLMWSQLVRSLLTILDCFLVYFVPGDTPKIWVPNDHQYDYRLLHTTWAQQQPIMRDSINRLEIGKKQEIFDSVFLFAFLWSFGAAIDLQSRPSFDVFLR